MMNDPHNETPAAPPSLNEAAHNIEAEQNLLNTASRSPLTLKKSAAQPAASSEELPESTSAQSVIAPKPAAAPTPTPAKVAISQKQDTAQPAPTPAPSISIDPDSGPSVTLLVVDALAAAIAIAFTVLLVQDTLPFLK